MGEFVEHLKRKAESAGCEVIELNAYKLKISQYDPATNAYRQEAVEGKVAPLGKHRHARAARRHECVFWRAMQLKKDTTEPFSWRSGRLRKHC